MQLLRMHTHSCECIDILSSLYYYFFFQNMEQGFFYNIREFLSNVLSVELFPVVFFVPFFCREFFYKCETSLLAGKQFEVQNIL